MHEARIEPTEHGPVPADDGWWVLSAGEVAWHTVEGGGTWCMFESPQARSATLGIGIHVLGPGEAPGLYHLESTQEGFLVLAGECLAIVEGGERRLRQWDDLHCPPGTALMAHQAAGRARRVERARLALLRVLPAALAPASLPCGSPMPELPEVESARALIAERALGREIVAVDDTDTYVCRPHAPGEIAAALVGRRLTEAHRRGKSMWVDTDGGPVLGLHLGMAGRIVVDDAAAGDYVRDGGAKHEPVWDRFTLRFADGGALMLRDKRRLGRAVLDPDLSGLGPDAAEVGRDAFRARVGRGEAPLKARIMDQAVIAGVGNLLADEALWRARLDPRRPAGDLDEAELDRLRREIRAATRRAMERGGVHTGDLVEHRVRGGLCPRCGAELRRATIGGRTTYWCSAEQGA